MGVGAGTTAYVFTKVIASSNHFQCRKIGNSAVHLTKLVLSYKVSASELCTGLCLGSLSLVGFRTCIRGRVGLAGGNITCVFISGGVRGGFTLSGRSASATISYLSTVGNSLV